MARCRRTPSRGEACGAQGEILQQALWIYAGEFSDSAQQVAAQRTHARGGRGLHGGVLCPQLLPGIGIASAGAVDEARDKGSTGHDYRVFGWSAEAVMLLVQGPPSE